MYVVFLYGRPATGKYTIGNIVADELDIPLFHNHLTVDLVGSLFEFGTPEFIEMREKIWLDSFEASAQVDQSFVFTFNPENTVKQSTIDKMRRAIEGNSGEILFIELTCDEKEIENRIEDKSRAEFGKLTEVELYKKLKADGAFDSPLLPEPLLKVDTSSLSAGDAAAGIVSVVGERV